jgi:two-component system, sensor histidine kinase and response regulator
MEAPGQRTPIIAVTAGTLKGEKAKCLAAGMDDYLSKPIDKMAMAEIFNKWWKKISPKAPPKKERSSPLPAQFDVEELKARLQGSPELILELLAMVPKVLEATLAEMEAAIEAKNWDQLALLAHRTRGNALNMSFHNLAALAEQLRMQISKDPNALEELFSVVKKEMKEVSKLARKMDGA